MDPDTALLELRKRLLDYHHAEEQHYDQGMASAAEDIVTQFEALDKWIADGGFLPRRWQHEASR